MDKQAVVGIHTFKSSCFLKSLFKLNLAMCFFLAVLIVL